MKGGTPKIIGINKPVAEQMLKRLTDKSKQGSLKQISSNKKMQDNKKLVKGGGSGKV